jgi:hypothetical protein
MTKALVLVLLIPFVLLLVTGEADAQPVRVDYDFNFGRVQNATNDSASTAREILLRYAGSAYPAITGQVPDSITIARVATATGDSIKAQFSSLAGFGVFTYSKTIIDTIAAAGTTTKTVTRSTYAGRDKFGLQVKGLTGNALAGTNSLWVRVSLWFTKPR